MRRSWRDHSLSAVLLICFVASLGGHVGGQLMMGWDTAEFIRDLGANWQAVFIEVLIIVLATKFLRERGSPESK